MNLQLLIVPKITHCCCQGAKKCIPLTSIMRLTVLASCWMLNSGLIAVSSGKNTNLETFSLHHLLLLTRSLPHWIYHNYILTWIRDQLSPSNICRKTAFLLDYSTQFWQFFQHGKKISGEDFLTFLTELLHVACSSSATMLAVSQGELSQVGVRAYGGQSDSLR